MGQERVLAVYTSTIDRHYSTLDLYFSSYILPIHTFEPDTFQNCGELTPSLVILIIMALLVRNTMLPTTNHLISRIVRPRRRIISCLARPLTIDSRRSTLLKQTSPPIQTQSTKMSFSNADTGGKTADPYTAKNIQDPSLKEKVEDFVDFAEKSKFCMMTTKTSDGLLASRCMALAAKVAALHVYQP